MRFCGKVWAAAFLVAAPMMGLAASCTSQAELSPMDRDGLAAVGGRLTQAVLQQDYATLQGALLPAVSGDWDSIRGEVELGAPLVKNGQPQLRNVYLLDNTAATAPADAQFFCSNASGTLTVTIAMRALPAGRYALVLADASRAPLGGQIGIVLGWVGDGAEPGWKLGGLSVRQGAAEGHDGVWYWSRARALAAADEPWSASFSYDIARYLLVPVDFLSSPNLDKLAQEQSQIKDAPAGIFPLSLQDGDRTWKIDNVHIDLTLHEPDLSVIYEATGVTDPAALRTEATAVLSAVLKHHPKLRPNFHGMWAVSSKDGKLTPVMELPMGQIP